MRRRIKTILLADDEADFVEMLKLRLEKQGYKVIVAQDGMEAIDKAKKFQPDLILLDIIMPRLDGELVILRMKSDPETEQIPIIMLTGVGDIHDVHMSANLGADAYFTKPFDTQALLAKIKELLEK